jgi:pyruvate/2-oxoglutarate dehydrogenase complex dihydrolipoamide dehydrogenase (E3) component
MTHASRVPDRTYEQRVDVIVVGGGPGGLTAATQAARRGASVVLVADGPLGGDCTHTGCVPSKALLSAAAAGHSFDQAMAAVRDSVARIAATEDQTALERVGVRVVRGRGELRAVDRLHVDGVELCADHIIIATGGTAALPPIPRIDTVDALTNETVFTLDRRPERLAVLGGGAIGCELAQAFARLGVRVNMIEAAERILSLEEPEASTTILATLTADGVDVAVGTRVVRVSGDGTTRRLHLDDGTDLALDHLLVATGRRPVTTGLGLERLGVELDPAGRIVVDDRCATNVPGIWAIGDVTALGGFTHVAAHMGFVAAANTSPGRRWRTSGKVDRRVVPRVTFTDPEVASVGITEGDAARIGGRVAMVRFDHVDRAITSRRETGFVKLITGPRPLLGSLGGGQVLGATVVGPRAGEMIAEVALAMRTRMFTGRLAQTIHAYPTWSTAIQQAATGFFFASDGVEVRPARPETSGTRPNPGAGRHLDEPGLGDTLDRALEG